MYIYIYVFVSVLHTYTYPTPVPKALLSSLFQCYLKGNHVPEARGRDMGMSQYSEMEWALSLCIWFFVQDVKYGLLNSLELPSQIDLEQWVLNLHNPRPYRFSRKATKRRTSLRCECTDHRMTRGRAFCRRLQRNLTRCFSLLTPALASCEFWLGFPGLIGYRIASKIIYIYICTYLFSFYASIDLPAIRDVSILIGRSLPYIAYMLLSSFGPWQYQAIDDQPICTSNLC